MIKKGRGGIIILFVIVLAIAIFVTFFYTPKCGNIACWESKLQKCSKASFINDANDVTWQYVINAKSGKNCVVNVKVLQIKKGLISAISLERKSMECLLPLGIIVQAESNPALCHGLLKEEMQTLIINKLHEYIIQNVGSISQEITGIKGITSINPSSTNSTNVTSGINSSVGV
jgi:hypothetical protein